MKRTTAIKSVIAAMLFGIVFHVTLPVLLVFVANILLSVMTVLDPLHAKDHLEDMWTALLGFGISQALIALAAGVAVGIGTAFLNDRMQSVWAYGGAAGISLVIHMAFLICMMTITYVLLSDSHFAGLIGLSAIAVPLAAPFMGLICTAVVRRSKQK